MYRKEKQTCIKDELFGRITTKLLHVTTKSLLSLSLANVYATTLSKLRGI